MIFRILIILSLIFTILSSLAANHICLFDNNVKRIYYNIIDLKLDLARQEIQLLPKKNSNFAYLLLEDYIDFFELFIYEDPNDYKKSLLNKEVRLKKIQKSNLPKEWSWFLQSEINLHWSLLYLKANDKWKAYQCVKEAYQLLKKCQIEFPNFKYYKKSLGILETLLGTIPDEFDWAIKILGFEGSLIEGKNHLLEFIDNDKSDFFNLEAIAAYSFILAYLENHSPKGLEYWNNHADKSVQGFLLVNVVQVKLMIKSGKMEEAKLIMESIKKERINKVPYLVFLSGLIKLQNLETSAEKDFLNYINLFKGLSYRKESYQKLAWISMIRGQDFEYFMYMSKCLQQGEEITDEDKQAVREAKSGEKPDLLLLKARLLCDGANYIRAYNLLFKNIEKYYNSPNKLEFCYRMGRICQMLGKSNEALSFFKDAIAEDKKKTSYLSAYSILNTALIIENSGEKSVACTFFEEALKRRPDQYLRSLQQKSKTGLIRLKCR